ncbi:MAG TPA: hypothetical protein VIU34_08535 [Steroidobacter sp.]
MARVLRILGILTCVVVLSACQSLPTTAYNKADSKVTSVGLAPMGIPKTPSVRILASVGANFGLIGAAIEESRAAAASKELQEIFAQSNYDYRKDIQDSLALAFSEISMPLGSAPGERPAKEQVKFMTNCPAVSGADACLDVFLTYVGYMSAGATTDYVPTVHMTAKLVRASDRTTLFQDQVHYNALAGTKAIVVQPSDEFRFKDRDAMKADPQRVTAGMQQAVRAATNELAKQFR